MAEPLHRILDAMTDTIARHSAFLKILYDCKPRQRKALIEYISTGQLHALSQVALNILKGNVKLSPSDINKLRRYKNIILLLSTRGESIQKKKEALLKHTSVIRLLLKHIIPLLDG